MQEAVRTAEAAAAASAAELASVRSGADAGETESQKQIRQLKEQLQIAEEEADELREELSHQACVCPVITTWTCCMSDLAMPTQQQQASY